MLDLLVYENDEGGISIVVPSGEIPIEEVAAKDVPAGKPYRYISSATDLPPDRYFRDAWEADLSNPDGYGIGDAAWRALRDNN